MGSTGPNRVTYSGHAVDHAEGVLSPTSVMSLQCWIRNEAYLDKGCKPASATSNLQHLDVFTLCAVPSSLCLHEVVQRHQALPLHGILPSQK